MMSSMRHFVLRPFLLLFFFFLIFWLPFLFMHSHIQTFVSSAKLPTHTHTHRDPGRWSCLCLATHIIFIFPSSFFPPILLLKIKAPSPPQSSSHCARQWSCYYECTPHGTKTETGTGPSPLSLHLLVVCVLSPLGIHYHHHHHSLFFFFSPSHLLLLLPPHHLYHHHHRPTAPTT